MVKYIAQQDACAAEFIEGKLGRKVWPPFSGFIVIDSLKVIGAVILNNFDPGLSVEITVAGRGAFGIREVREIARFIFIRLDCQRITAITEETNYLAINTLKILGFKEEGRLRDRFKDNDGLLFGITRDEQRAIRI